ncbi:exosome complex exonuclease RRP42-like [Watersipora subatra]|uniref:exosome complex exonuclease RRP42-like n=1 Tax=Watersipora subatra TaxID=2589382 RepID=UPI00355B3845
MAALPLSHAEKIFIIHGIEDNLRNDGRSRLDYRSFEIETGTVSTASGSARLRLANTDVLVGVKAELGVPALHRPKEGNLEFFVHCSANAAPEFEGRGGEELANDISSTLSRAYEDRNTLNLEGLCVAQGQHCWLLYIDVLLLEVGGNLYDAVSIAVKSALYDTKIPNLTLTTNEEGEVEIDLSEDPFDYIQINVEKCPVLVTCNKIGKTHIIDATMDEETCSLCRLVISVTQAGSITCMKKIGSGSLLPESLIDMINTAKDVGMALNRALLHQLNKEGNIEDRRYMGFLR